MALSVVIICHQHHPMWTLGLQGTVLTHCCCFVTLLLLPCPSVHLWYMSFLPLSSWGSPLSIHTATANALRDERKTTPSHVSSLFSLPRSLASDRVIFRDLHNITEPSSLLELDAVEWHLLLFLTFLKPALLKSGGLCLVFFTWFWWTPRIKLLSSRTLFFSCPPVWVLLHRTVTSIC